MRAGVLGPVQLATGVATVSTFFLLASGCSRAVGADWPQWQGPDRDGLSRETGLLREWSEEGPPRSWLFDGCGAGYGGPAIVDGRLFLMGARRGEAVLICLKADDGAELWAKSIGRTYSNDYGDGPRGTPTVVGRSVYALAGRGRLVCLDTVSGAERWSTELTGLGGKIPEWGYSESPLVIGGKVLCTPGGDGGAITALDRSTGEPIWRCEEVTDRAHYSSMRVIKNAAARLTAVQLLASRLVAVDVESGRLDWSVPWGGTVAVIPTPVTSGGSIFVTSGYGAGCMLVDPRGEGPSVVYSSKAMSNHHGGVISLEGRLYGYADRRGWVCLDAASGRQLWRERRALEKGAIAYADGRLYCLGEKEGEVVLVDASPEGWTERGRFRLEPQSNNRKASGGVWTHPVIANGRLYLRDQEYLSCFDIRS